MFARAVVEDFLCALAGPGRAGVRLQRSIIYLLLADVPLTRAVIFNLFISCGRSCPSQGRPGGVVEERLSEPRRGIRHGQDSCKPRVSHAAVVDY